MKNQRAQSGDCLVCVFLCSRVRLPMFRAAVESTECTQLPAPADLAWAGVACKRVVCHSRPPAPRFLIWSRTRTELARFTRAAMLRTQTLVCAPERSCRPRSANFPGVALDV